MARISREATKQNVDRRIIKVRWLFHWMSRSSETCAVFDDALTSRLVGASMTSLHALQPDHSMIDTCQSCRVGGVLMSADGNCKQYYSWSLAAFQTFSRNTESRNLWNIVIVDRPDRNIFTWELKCDLTYLLTYLPSSISHLQTDFRYIFCFLFGYVRYID